MPPTTHAHDEQPGSANILRLESGAGPPERMVSEVFCGRLCESYEPKQPEGCSGVRYVAYLIPVQR